MYNDIYKCNRDGNDKKMNSFNRKIHNQNDPPSILNCIYYISLM